ncbi:epoxide hydrolase [Burkholderia stabilis]|nr:epoxide hydrolase [Burkholderia stabilis]
MTMTDTRPESHDDILAATRHWLARAVIGLNLCPFAKSVYVKEQVRYAISEATTLEDALAELETELRALDATDPQQVDTTLVIFPHAFADFVDYNDALFFADRLVRQLRLDGVLQIASFHPQYRFEGSEPDDIENYTNRAPYPILHLLREDSIARAVDAFPDASAIYEKNQETLRRLGHDGWREWMRRPGDDV